ncbi:MAG: hypothetical protein AAF915_03860 [Cyanobacteria bacterium P01_D01_bin.50]
MLQPYSQKKQRMTDGIHSISRMVGDPKFHTHQKINTKSIDLWKQEYQSDFLTEESWQIAEQLGYERLKNKSLSNLVTFQSQGNKKPLFSRFSRLLTHSTMALGFSRSMSSYSSKSIWDALDCHCLFYPRKLVASNTLCN